MSFRAEAALWLLLPALGGLSEVVRLAPGDPLLKPSRIREGTDSSFMIFRRDGQERPGPVQVESIRRTSRNGTAVFEHIITVDGGRFRMADTTWYAAATLAPIAHRSHGAGRSFALDYHPGRVTGQTTDSAGTTPIDVPLPSPAFDPSALHAVIRSLELAPGRSYVIPLFHHEKKAIVADTMVVEGEATVETDGGPVAAWRCVLATEDRSATYFIAKADGTDLKVLVTWKGGELHIRHSGVK